MLCQSILIRGNCIFGNLSFETVRMLGSKLVAAVLSKGEGAHEQAEHDVEHGQEADGEVLFESLGQNQEHLQNVLSLIVVLQSFVSSLGLVNVSFADFFLYVAEMSFSSFCKQFHFFDFQRLVMFLLGKPSSSRGESTLN